MGVRDRSTGIPNRVIVTATVDGENHVIVDITGVGDATSIRQRIVGKLRISADVAPSARFYRAELGETALGEALTDDQLALYCRAWADGKGTLKFFVQQAAPDQILPQIRHEPPPGHTLPSQSLDNRVLSSNTFERREWATSRSPSPNTARQPRPLPPLPSASIKTLNTNTQQANSRTPRAEINSPHSQRPIESIPQDQLLSASPSSSSPSLAPDTSRNHEASSNVSQTTSVSANEEPHWFYRPAIEQIQEDIAQFFPEQAFDTEAQAATPAPVVHRIPHRKSIRYIAEQQSNLGARNREGSAPPMARRRATKLWRERDSNEAPNEEIPAGQDLGGTPINWIRGELIGKGTYARVYLALNVHNGEMMAMKQVEMPQTVADKEDARQTHVIAAIKHENSIHAKLSHPNVVQYLGFEETPSFYSIFLEYLPGTTIGRSIRQFGPLAENVVRSFTAQIVEGLLYLHDNNIIHRDIKADNVHVDLAGTCKISDFAIAKLSNTSAPDDIYITDAELTSMQGSLFWMAPEVISSQKGYSAKVDIWSLGCVLLEMTSGRRPWADDDFVAVLFKVGSSRFAPPLPNDITLPVDAERFREECFKDDPNDRPTARALKAHPWLQLPPGWSFTRLPGFDEATSPDPTHEPVLSTQGEKLSEYREDDHPRASAQDSSATVTSTNHLSDILTKLEHLRIVPARYVAKEDLDSVVGGFGDVLFAILDENSSSERVVAIKVLRPTEDRADRTRLATRLVRELKLWASLKHPNILPLIGFYLSEDMTVAQLVSPFMEQGHLARYLKSQSLGIDERVQLALDTIRGLEYLHGLDPPICHGDLKSNNVLINDECRAVLCDFGLATLVGSDSTGLTTSKGFKGYIRHLSPEIVMHEGFHRTLQSDMWAWSCLFLEILCGARPFDKLHGDLPIIFAIIQGQAPANLDDMQHLPVKYKQLILSCWEADPSKRPTAAQCRTSL